MKREQFLTSFSNKEVTVPHPVSISADIDRQRYTDWYQQLQSELYNIKLDIDIMSV